MLSEQVRNDLISIRDGLKESLEEFKTQASNDLVIDDIDLDRAVLDTPKIHNKYNSLFADATITLKEFYSFGERVKLERWKYWSGKQTDKYYSTHGNVHEKILKSDLDKYLGADEKIILVKDIISIQKTICDFLEKCIKEIQTRNFHIKAAIDWRKFTNGVI